MTHSRFTNISSPKRVDLLPQTEHFSVVATRTYNPVTAIWRALSTTKDGRSPVSAHDQDRLRVLIRVSFHVSVTLINYKLLGPIRFMLPNSSVHIRSYNISQHGIDFHSDFESSWT